MMFLAPTLTAIAVGMAVHLVARRRRRPSRRPVRGWAGLESLGVTRIQFWGVSAGVGALTYLVVMAMTQLPVIALMPAVVLAALPRAYYGRKRAQRLVEVQESWPDGIRDVISSVRSGASVSNAVEDLSRFGPEPLRRAFSSFPVYSRSLGFVAALEMIRADLSDPTSDRVVEVLIVAHERGGAVVPDILADLADATTKDIWALEQVRTEALEQKINSRVVFVLPWLVLVAMTSQSGPFREFYSSPTGIFVAFLGGAMSLIGILVASRLGRQPEEPRVLRGGGTSL